MYPLYYHSNIQTLHLAEVTPLLPPLWSLVPFSAQSPFARPIIAGSLLGLATWRSLAFQAASSHFLQSFLFTRLTISLHSFFSTRISRSLPHPAADSVNSTAFLSDIELDILEEELDTAIAAGVGVTEAIEIEAIIERDDDYTATIEISEMDLPQSRTYTATPVPADAAPQSNPLYLDQEESENTPPAAPAPPTPTPATPAPAATTQQSSSVAVPVGAAVPKRHGYRTTALAIHPVDALSMHLADCFCNVAVLLLESAMMRSLVRSILANRFNTSDGTRMINDVRIDGMVYRPWEMAGHGLVAKALVVGEWGLNWALFELSWGVCWVVGKKWFGYGK